MFAIVVVSIIFLLNFLWLINRRGSKRKSTVPGVTPSDSELGNLGDVDRAGSLHEYLIKLHKKFGPIASFYWGKQRVVSIASPEAFRDTRRLFDRPVLLFSAYKLLMGAYSIQYANGETGRYRRKNHYDAALYPIVHQEQFFNLFQDIIREKINSWQLKEGQPIPLHSEMISIAIRSVTAATLRSSILIGEDKHIEEAYDICMGEMEMRLKGQPANPEREEEFNRGRNYFVTKIKEIIVDRRQRSHTDEKCFIDYILDDEENVTSEEHICDEVITMFIGGFHTTGNLLTWTLYYLAKDQTIQQRLYNELIETYDTEFPSFEQIEKLTYLTSVLNESLRHSVLAPWAARFSTHDEIICGKTIPANTPILHALGVVLQDDKIWTNPQEFNPDRFSHENQKQIPTLGFSPFGFAGKRICPGYRFAQHEATLYIAAIIRKYKVTLDDPTIPVVPQHGLVTSPKDEIFVQFTQRKC